MHDAALGGAPPALLRQQLRGGVADLGVPPQDNEMVILGTQYAGEMKKGVFGLMHYLMPKAGVLSLHSSATEGEP